MKPTCETFDDDELRATAARWLVRRDRGLSAAESIEYELWLAADPRHATALHRSTAAWARLDHVPETVATAVLAAAQRRRRFWRQGFVASSLAAAAALAFVVRGGWPPAPAPVTAPPPAAMLQAAGPRLLTLADGTEVRLNAGGEITEEFTAAERTVRLARGEAHFTVTKDPARPFVVTAGAMQVRAIGTAFYVNLQPAQVEVLVTAGRVAVATTPDEGMKPSDLQPHPDAAPRPTTAPAPAELGAGERAVLSTLAARPSRSAPDLVVTRVDAAEMTRTLAWQDELVRFGGATLAEIAAEFERRTGHRVILADPALAQVRLGGRIRADNVEGFSSLLATMLEIEVERDAGGAIVLRKKKSD